MIGFDSPGRKKLRRIVGEATESADRFAAQYTVPDAAQACGLSEATLHRYLHDDVFKAHYRRARSEIVEHAIVQLQRDCAIATKTLRDVCESTEAPASARVAAAKTILDGAVKAVELQDLTARMEALEQSVEANKQGAGQ